MDLTAGAERAGAAGCELAPELEGASAEDVLRWALATVPRLAATSSFGAHAAVLLHLLSRIAPRVPVLFLDTGYHFDETLDHRRALAAQLGLHVVDVRPALTVEEQDARHGPELSARDPDACCRLRKREPLDRALGAYDGWLTGIRRQQTLSRARTPVVGAERRGGRTLLKIAPLVAWSDADVDAYMERHGLAHHPLVAAGYRSIGCAPCSAPVATGEDARAGRWSGSAKTECGLHLAP